MRTLLILLTMTFVLFMFPSCKKDIVEKDKPNIFNPIDSINSFYLQAEKIAGEGISLYLITGVQKDTISSLNYNLNWRFYFIKNNRLITFEIIQNKTKVEDLILEKLPMGYEFINKNDDRLKSILSPKIIWDSCVNKYKKTILNIEIFAPLLAQKSDFVYRFYSKEGNLQLGVDYFVYNAKTGVDLTNK